MTVRIWSARPAGARGRGWWTRVLDELGRRVTGRSRGSVDRPVTP